MNTSRITKRQSSYSTSLYIYIYVLRSTGGPVGEEYPPSRTDLLHGLDVRFSAGKKQKIPEIPSRGNMWKLHGLDTFWRFCAKFCMSILCLWRYMRISTDLSFVAIGYLYDWCSLCFSSFTTEMAFKFNISSFIIHSIMIFIYTVYLSLWYTFNTLHMYHTSLVLETYPKYSKLMSHFIAPLLDQVGDTETSTIKTGVEEQTSRQQ